MCDDMARSPDLTDRDPRRKMWNFLSPIALFASKGNKNGKNELVPVAIQMDYKPGKMLHTCDRLRMPKYITRAREWLILSPSCT